MNGTPFAILINFLILLQICCLWELLKHKLYGVFTLIDTECNPLAPTPKLHSIDFLRKSHICLMSDRLGIASPYPWYRRFIRCLKTSRRFCWRALPAVLRDNRSAIQVLDRPSIYIPNIFKSYGRLIQLTNKQFFNSRLSYCSVGQLN